MKQHAATRTLELKWGHEIETKPIDWLWQPWLPKGVIAVIDGDPGVGKSSLTMDLVARMTTGKPFFQPKSKGEDPETPDSESDLPSHFEFRTPKCCLIVALEDSLERVVVPRLEAAGADLTKVALLGGVTETGADGVVAALLQFPRDLDLMVAKCYEHRPALLIIDPFFAVLGYDEDGRFLTANGDQSVRRLTGRLKSLAETLDMTIVLVRHLNKSSGNAVKRGSGSIAIAPQARSVMLVGRDPLEPDARILAMTKANLSTVPRSLRFRMVGAGGSSRIEWLSGSDLLADDLTQPDVYEESRKGVLLTATYFLKTTLCYSNGLTWTELVSRAWSEEGITEITLRRAREELNLTKRSAGKNNWIWELPQSVKLQMQMGY